MFMGFCFNNIFCAATNFGCIDSFLLPNSRNEEMMGDGSFGATAAVCLNSKRLLSTSCNKQVAQWRVAFFSWCYSRCFLRVRRIVCVKIKQTLNNELKFHIVNIY